LAELAEVLISAGCDTMATLLALTPDDKPDLVDAGLKPLKYRKFMQTIDKCNDIAPAHGGGGETKEAMSVLGMSARVRGVVGSSGGGSGGGSGGVGGGGGSDGGDGSSKSGSGGSGSGGSGSGRSRWARGIESLLGLARGTVGGGGGTQAPPPPPPQTPPPPPSIPFGGGETKAAETKTSAMTSGDTCSFCHTNTPEMALVPCGHRCLCKTCDAHAAKVAGASGSRACPICKEVVTASLRVS
jgi:hypothetical protein